jgi:hypothetical protein
MTKVAVRTLHGTFLYAAATSELNAKRKVRYEKKKTSTAAGPAPAAASAPQSQEPPPMAMPIEADDLVLRNDDESICQTPDGGYWKAFYVRFKANGEVHYPLELVSIMLDDDVAEDNAQAS